MWWQDRNGVWNAEWGDRNRPNACRLMWPDEWDSDEQVLALQQNQHVFTEVSYLNTYSKNRRFPCRSSGVTMPESWLIDDGLGAVKRWETLVDLTTDEREMRKRLAYRKLPGNPPTLWRGDAVRQHYLFEDLGTATMFKLLWCKGT
ncbi:MAG: hypothetical protein EOP83_21185 [Verrucomicrobiaceae bacterium]|nr:MAG: hypothetical protein EOP83_21185 [Verrucomicrobiaceae bacterium]